ncbi:hypothetical protein AWW66_00455 [Micromonospora rosaria]|uniref:EamA domain-containing protein n=1 Tax=Micromonospora rosaria TaxID=47874 RepID=A0A136Q065_9ACTN|nr:DMT family transporter [Micromonospora rosaria]KXK63954.1 hypothetical protein AWW66_00455 [Micromonospora rosaria]
MALRLDPDTAAVVLQAVALRLGPLAVVQPVMASGLFMAVLIEAAVLRRRVVRRDLCAVTVGVTGLAVFLLLADIGAGVPSVGAAAWTAPVTGAAVIVSACVGAAHRVTGAARGALLGVAGGLAYSFAAALVKDLTGRYHGNPWTTLATWPTAALLVAVAVGLLLNQTAFQHGRLAAPLTALTLTDPIAGFVIGVTVFRETLTPEPARLAGLVVSGGVVAVGVWLAATTTPTRPAVAGRRSDRS